MQATIIRCPCCSRADVAIGGVCPKCHVGIPGDGPVKEKSSSWRTPKKARVTRPIFNQIRIP